MPLPKLPNEIWRRIFFYMQEPSTDDIFLQSNVSRDKCLGNLLQGFSTDAIFQRKQPQCHQLPWSGSLCSYPQGVSREIDGKALHSLSLVSKECRAHTMAYVWSNVMLLPSNFKSFAGNYFPNTVFKQAITNSVLICDLDAVFSSCLSNVTHFYVNNLLAELQIGSPPMTKINPLKLASPAFLPNLKTLTAYVRNQHCSSSIGNFFMGTLKYKQLAIELNIGTNELIELSESLAGSCLRFVTSLVLQLRGPALHNVKPVGKMIKLQSLSLVGATVSPTFLSGILSSKPTLKSLDISQLRKKCDHKYGAIGNSVTELNCRDLAFDSMSKVMLSFPMVKKLSLVLNTPNFQLDTSHIPFTNLEEFVCQHRTGTRYEQVFNMCMTILRLNSSIKHFTMTHVLPALWSSAQDDFFFPNVRSVHFLYCAKNKIQESSNMLNSLLKIFPLCETIEIPVDWLPDIDYEQLKRSVLTNQNLRYIVIRFRFNCTKKVLPDSLFSNFVKAGFSISDFCFPLVPTSDQPFPQLYVEEMRRKVLPSLPRTTKGSYVIDVQLLRTMILALSDPPQDFSTMLETFVMVNIDDS